MDTGNPRTVFFWKYTVYHMSYEEMLCSTQNFPFLVLFPFLPSLLPFTNVPPTHIYEKGIPLYILLSTLESSDDDLPRRVDFETIGSKGGRSVEIR
jgi:hypothetical protein